jgi:sialidase-1
MKRISFVTILALTSFAFAVERTAVWTAGEGAYKSYRIPAVLVTRSGAILALCEGRRNSRSDTGEINLISKRSSDGGKTFGESQIVWADGPNTCGNPCPVIDQSTGTIWLLMTHNPGHVGEPALTTNPSAGARTVWITKSTDDGVTWDKPRDITADVKKPEWSWYATGPGVGIQLKSGRLVIPCDHVAHSTGKGNSHIIYSDDHGQTWKIGGEPEREEFNESQCVELSDGRLMLNMRNHAPAIKAGAPKERGVAISSDGGLTFTDLRRDPALIEPVCQASITRIGKQILFANPASQSKRIEMTVRASDDDGQTWPTTLRIYEGPAAYSCLVALPDGQVGLLYECGEKTSYDRIEFARFRLNQK